MTKKEIETEKIKEAFEELEKYEKIIPIRSNTFTLFDKVIDPIFETVQKIESVIDKLQYIGTVLKKAKEISPFINQIMGNNINFSI